MMTQPRSIVAVSGESRRDELLAALLNDESGYDVIHVASIQGAYSRIRELGPEVVVVLCDIQDVDACRLLSMLNVDPALSGVLVLTCAKPSTNESADCLPEMFSDMPAVSVTPLVN